jgi:hypothetical protein
VILLEWIGNAATVWFFLAGFYFTAVKFSEWIERTFPAGYDH